MEALGINLGFLIVQILNFIIVMLVLSAWAYGPIVEMLNDRKRKIAQGLDDARIAADARANAEKEAKKILDAAQAEANKRVQDSVTRAEKAGADARATAEEERKRLIESAKEEAALERTRILGDLRGQVAALSIAAANKIIGEALDEKRQHALIQEFFSGIKANKVTVLEGAAVSGAEAEVTSALPLSADEQATVKRDVGAANVNFKVDPAILGGLVVRVGDKIIDGSVAGKLEGLRTNLR